MTPLEAELVRISAALTDAGVAFAMVGGLAVSARTEPRFTRDADLAVKVDDDARAEALIRRLQAGDYRVHGLIEQDAVGRLATVRLDYSRQSGSPIVDLLFASSGIEPEIVTDAEDLELLPNLRVRVAQTGHLIALKVLSRDDESRPQDLVDLRALLRAANRLEIDRARSAVALIAERGFHRGRDVKAHLDKLLTGQL